MRYILALSVLLMTGTAFGTISVPRTELKAEDFERLGIEVSAIDSNSSASAMFFPVVVTLNVESFTACTVRSVYLSFVDEFENLMAGASVALGNRGYVFQVRREFFTASRLTFSCNGIHEYVINVGREVPVVNILDR